ncbi:MAG TPA: MlaD family protein [Chitinivibrionales bacterium]|jgi:ABC-type transporter Mla subunit MlaD|nr:MlaD family protein [Chitinivibrionales bacterium]
MSDRKLGYMIITLFLLIVAVILFYGLRPLLSRGETRVVAFKEIGNLRYQDPVRVRGVLFGTAKKIEWKGDHAGTTMRAYVTIKSTMPIPIHRGFLVVNMDEGLMGDRAIMIDCGDSTAPLIPVRDTLPGAFYPGVSEALNNAWRLRGVIDTFLAVSETLAHGAGTQQSLIAQANQAISSADSISKMVLGMTRNADFTAGAQVRSLNSFVNSTATMTRSLSATGPDYVENTRARLRDIAALASRLRRSTDTLAELSASLRSPNNILWKSDIEAIGKHLVELQSAIAAVQQRLLQFKVYLKL